VRDWYQSLFTENINGNSLHCIVRGLLNVVDDIVTEISSGIWPIWTDVC